MRKYRKRPPAFSYQYSSTSQYIGVRGRRRILCVCVRGGGVSNTKGVETGRIKGGMPLRSRTGRHNTRQAELRNARTPPPPLPTASWEISRGRAKVFDYGGSALHGCHLVVVFMYPIKSTTWEWTEHYFSILSSLAIFASVCNVVGRSPEQ